jgi:potassium channel subfamily K
MMASITRKTRIRSLLIFLLYPLSSFAFLSRAIHVRPLRARQVTPILVHFPVVRNENHRTTTLFDVKEEAEGEVVQRKSKSSRFVTRVLANFWFVLVAPYSDLRRMLKRFRDSDDIAFSLRLRDGLVAVLVYLGVAVFAYHIVFEKWSVVDSLYFACVCFSTVGYGDLTPQTVGGKIFTCFFGFAGISLLGAAVATIGSKLVQAEAETVKIAQKESRKRILQLYDKLPKIRSASKKGGQGLAEEVRKEYAARSRIPKSVIDVWKTVRWLGQSLLVVAAGGLILGRIEGWNVIDSLYYALITASTIGLGDFSPTTRAGRLLSLLLIPMTVAAAGEILASIGLALIEQRQKKIFSEQLEQGLTSDHLKAMDANGDGKVEREEYVLFMLMEMGLVNKQEIEDLFEQFERLDVTKSGYLDGEDLLLIAKIRDSIGVNM